MQLKRFYPMKPRIDPEDGIPCGYCNECGDWCEGILVDFGYGAYEFWGTKGFHEDWHWVSPCCEADIVDRKKEE
jgi:hypothetical protein